MKEKETNFLNLSKKSSLYTSFLHSENDIPKCLKGQDEAFSVYYEILQFHHVIVCLFPMHTGANIC